MEYTTLGRTGLQVSRLCLGTMTFGREIDEQDSHRLLDHFAEAGGNFVDTADAYGGGRSEEIVGSWLRKTNRDNVVLATKVRFGDGINRRGLGRKHILRSVDESLRRLGTDHLDLYQIHMWDYATPVEETLRTLDSLAASGKVRYLGVSNVADGSCSAWSTCAARPAGNRSSPSSRSTTCLTARRSGSSFPCAATKGWASSRGARCGEAG
jgi:aryl-alcohol dehydrogenase-like predicted oxidoreductase